MAVVDRQCTGADALPSWAGDGCVFESLCMHVCAWSFLASDAVHILVFGLRRHGERAELRTFGAAVCGHCAPVARLADASPPGDLATDRTAAYCGL